MEYTKSHGFLKKTRDTYNLVDRKDPELYRDLFPYSEVPKVVFDDNIVTFDVPEEIWITDTTFRDGQQSRAPFTVEQIVEIYKFLNRLSGKNGVIRQSEFFLYTDKDKKAVEQVLALGYRYPEVTGWIRAAKEDFKLVKQMGLKETGILTSVSDYHIFLKLKKTRKEAFDSYVEMVEVALENGVLPRCHLEDITRADIYGFVVPFVQKLMDIANNAKTPIKIRLCDTMGYGIPYPGATLPRGTAKLVHAFKNECGVPSEWLEWHGHNDFHKVVDNTVTAWLHGISAANCAIFGIGERTGNAPLEGLIFEYISLMGSLNGIDTLVITEMKEYFEKELGHQFPKNYPFIGEDFNVTRAGIHADGLVKNEEIYNIFDTQKLLNRPLSVSISDKSGTAGILHWIYKKYPAALEKNVTKKHPAILKIYDWIMDEYNLGRSTSISDEEMEKLVIKYLPELSTSPYAKFRKKLADEAVSIIEHIATKNELKSMVPQKIEPILEEMALNDQAMKLLSVTNTKGKKITKNITQIEDKKAYEHKLLDEDFSDRDWFIQPIKHGSSYISDLYMSKITGNPTITVSTPVFDHEEKIIGILAIDFNFDELAMEIG
ncbi:MAG: histone-lysine N-methyltransferase [Candidatus Margulisbacteria bacterium]|nr:histone-lysine N-methyltransferase [Candidatus Margulisiibacteriota bacterium]